MAIPDPTMNLAMLPSAPASQQFQSHSHVPSRAARDFDPLLRDLSPTSTLRLFASAPQSSDYEYGPTSDLTATSASQRALGSQAAQLCLNLRSWARELEAWKWSGTFETPVPARRKIRTSSMISESGPTVQESTNSVDAVKESDYWGSLPAIVVQQHERRIAEITEQVDTIQVEELKDYVLSAHQRKGSLPKSQVAVVVSDLHRLDDFTAVVTATILQALPYLSKVNRLLNVWTIRLTVCKSAPSYIDDLQIAQQDLDKDWTLIREGATALKNSHSVMLNREAMHELKGVMEGHIRSLGRRLDRFLDELEGQDDAVPDSWIDDFESLESAYGEWVVEAEKRILEEEWRQLHDIKYMAPIVEEVPVHGTDELPTPSTPQMPLADEKVDAPREVPSPGHSRPRHVPIIIDYERDGKLYDPELAEIVKNEIDTPTSATVVTTSTASPPGPSIKKRTAFLKAEIERAESLQKQVKSPVRSFEHASNAFTRLFKKDRFQDDKSRQNSVTLPLSRSMSSQSHTQSFERGRTISAPVAAAIAGLDSASAKSVSPMTRSPNSPPASLAGRNGDTGGFFNRRRGWSDKRQDAPRDYVDLPGGPPQTLTSRGSSLSTKPAPATDSPTDYIQTSHPKRVSSLQHSPTPSEAAMSEDWPLTPPQAPDSDRNGSHSRSTGSTSDMRLPRGAIASEQFHDTFVQSLPSHLEEQVGVDQATVDDTVHVLHQEHEAPSAPSHQQRRESPALDGHDRDRNVTAQPTGRPEGMYIDLSNVTTPVLDNQSEHFDATPNSIASGVSPGEIRSASSVGYFSVQASPALSRLSSTDDGDKVRRRRQSASAINPTVMEVVIPRSRRGSANSQPYPLLKRASTTSIESHLRSELKAVNIRPRKSDSALLALSGLDSPSRSPTASLTSPKLPSSMMNRSHSSSSIESDDTRLESFPSPPTRTPSGADSPGSPGGISATTPTIISSSPVLGLAINHSPSSSADEAPLNAAMRKRRPQQVPQGPSRQALQLNEHSPSLRPSPHSRIVPEDSFDRHVSEVLEQLPGKIRFRSRAGAETPVSRVSDQRYPSGRSTPRYGHRQSRSNSIGMTIAPAGSSPKKTSTVADPVKLYHLRTEGREEPIKLFVRLVGAEERCMVRVGGGWQDLADYLRNYAEHHGSRTISGSGLEVFTADPNSLRRVSGPAGSRAQTPVPTTGSRPGSRDGPSPGLLNTLTTSALPNDDNGLAGSNPESPLHSPNYYQTTPSTSVPTNQQSTPRTLTSASKRNSRPSTAEPARPSSRASYNDANARASPASAKRGADLAEQKAKWVEGMLEKARASAEKSKDDRFVELSKIGGTRRVIFRSPSQQG